MLDAADFNRIMNSVRAILSSSSLQYNGATIQITKGGTGAATASQALTNLGATTVGKAFFTLPNPSAIRFVRINADNSVSELTDVQFRAAIGAGSGTGTVNAGTQYQATYYATTGSAVSGTADVILDTSGGSGLTKVGINNSSPAYPLHLNGDMLAYNSTYLDGLFYIDEDNIQIGDFNGDVNNTYLKVDDANSQILLFANTAIAINAPLTANNSLRLSDYGSGTHVGTPTYSLQVDASGNVIEGSIGGGGTVNAGTQYQLGYYAANGTAVSGLTLITASRLLLSDANGLPIAADTATYPSLTELAYLKGVSSAIQTQINTKALNLLTGYVSGAGVVAATDTVLQGIQKLNGNIGALVTGVSSVFSRTGAVVAANGDYTSAQVTEVTNLYFTNARAIAATLTAYSSGAGTISASDSVLSAIQKLNGNTAALVTGVSSVNSLTGAVALTGTASRITISATNVFDISASYVGQSSIITLGTITTGVWNGTAIANANLANSAVTINGSSVSLGGSVTVTAVASSIVVGTTAITSGSTGRILYDNAGTLGEMTTTGSGTVVALATSPNFVTPVLGTPSSGTLTSCLGLPFTGLTGSAYSFGANNTNGTAAATEQVFKSIAEQTYSGSITWTGTTAPSGSTAHTYQWQQVGKCITLRIWLRYGTAGSALTQVSMSLPADCPTPQQPSGTSGVNDAMLYFGTGWLLTVPAGSSAAVGRGYLSNDATATGFVIIVIGSSVAYKFATATIQYYIT